MKTLKAKVIGIAASLVTAVAAQAQISVTWGNSDEAIIFTDASGVALESGSLVLLGTFAGGTDFLNQGTNLEYLQNQFTTFDTTSISAGGYDGIDGYFTEGAVVNNLNTQLYYWIFNSSSAASATEWGIVTSPAWITPGTAPDILVTDMSQAAESGVRVGSLNTVSGQFRTAVTSAIPEPSSFAAVAGLGILGFAAMRKRRRA